MWSYHSGVIAGGYHMGCDECIRLQEEETDAWQSLQNQRTMNRQISLHGKEAKHVEQRLTRAYNLASAKIRLHKGKVHQNEGHTVSIEDVNIIIRDGCTRP
jgi:hypothetical protein